MLPQEVLKEYWGFTEFREPQKKIIENILAGQDVLAILATGGGKSLCYQLPAVMSSGLTIVVSPLIALMQDQVEGLNKRGINACFLNSSLLPGEYRKILEKIAHDRYKLLYLAPEQFSSEKLLNKLKETKISRIVIDEAHCLTEWGNDFRPEYRKFIVKVKNRFPQIQIIALTATATPKTREEIISILGLKRPFKSISSFDRKNLFFGVKSFFTPLGKYLFLRKKLLTGEKVLVYCATRGQTEKLAKLFSQKLKKTGFYHAGMTKEERNSAQEDFRESRINCLFATSAFGMGIDLADIKIVIYWNFPTSIEEYYQGIGRAGRDESLAAETWLFYSPEDYHFQKKRILEKNTSISEIKKINSFLTKNKRNKKISGSISEKRFNTLKILIEESEIKEKSEKEEFKIISKKFSEIKENKEKKLESLKKYAKTKLCLRKFILEYFGEGTEFSTCKKCSNC